MDLNGVEEVVERPDRGAVARWRAGDAWLGGGTWLFSEPQPGLRRLFDLNGFGWPALDADATGLRVAATCTIAELERWRAPADWRAAAAIPPCCRALLGSFKVWNGATVGGNLCLALPAGPMAALAVALDGVCRLWDAAGEREVPARGFVLGERRNALRPGEILRELFLPAAALRRRVSVRQISLTPHGRSGALLVGTRDGDGAFRLTVTGATVRPVALSYPAPPARERLLGDLSALPDALVFDDVHGRPAWRRAVAAELAGELLAELAGP